MLSQAEIDALLSGAIEIEEHNGQGRVNLADLLGQEPANASPQKAPGTDKNVVPYNFWSPDRFSKEQMRAVEMVHEDLAERLTTSLPSFLRTGLRPRVVHIEQGRFHDFLKDLPGNSLFHVITMAPLPGQMVIMISSDIGSVILEQRLGGRVGKKRDRALTEIDQSLLRGLVEHMLNDIKGAWSKVVAIEPGIEDTTVNQHWVQMMMGNERMMLITFELTIQDVTGTMNIYIPFSTLKPIANDLNPHAWIVGKKEKAIDPSVRQSAIENLYHVYLPVHVNLGTASVTMNELINLKPGDVLKLNTAIHQDVTIEVANQPRFRGQIGKQGKLVAIQVTGVARQEQENLSPKAIFNNAMA
jgi:flagellar motor switch protein FliM